MSSMRIVWTVIGAVGVCLIVFALLYVGAPGMLYFGDLIGDAKYQAKFATLVHIIGVGSNYVSLMLLAAAGWIVWLFARMRRRAGD